MTKFALTAALLGLLPAALYAQRGPAPTSTNLPPDVLRLACAPTLAYTSPSLQLRVTGGQDSIERHSHSPGDLITINGGTNTGVEVGQEFFVRRIQPEDDRAVSKNTPAGVSTSGWVRVYAVDDKWSLATITHACNTVDVGDYLEPFALPVPAVAQADAPKPQRDNYGRILFGADRRRSFGQGDFFTVDRGSDHGVTRGSRFVIYRDKQLPENFLFELGEAMAVEVGPSHSTLEALTSIDAFASGDYVALRK